MIIKIRSRKSFKAIFNNQIAEAAQELPYNLEAGPCHLEKINSRVPLQPVPPYRLKVELKFANKLPVRFLA